MPIGSSMPFNSCCTQFPNDLKCVEWDVKPCSVQCTIPSNFTVNSDCEHQSVDVNSTRVTVHSKHHDGLTAFWAVGLGRHFYGVPAYRTQKCVASDNQPLGHFDDTVFCCCKSPQSKKSTTLRFELLGRSSFAYTNPAARGNTGGTWTMNCYF